MNANYNLSEKFLRMIKDDEYFDVTKEDVKILLKRMSHHYSRDDIIKMRIKYDAWIDDKEKRLMEEFGLSYDTHEITKTCLESGRGISSTRGSFCINGYSTAEWKMLTDEDYVPTIAAVKNAINRIANRGDEEALEIIKNNKTKLELYFNYNTEYKRMNVSFQDNSEEPKAVTEDLI